MISTLNELIELLVVFGFVHFVGDGVVTAVMDRLVDMHALQDLLIDGLNMVVFIHEDDSWEVEVTDHGYYLRPTK